MGLEWHNRKRSIDGRFARKEKKLDFYAGAGHQQFHLRVPKELAERVRRNAIKYEQEINAFCCDALEDYCDLMEEEE